MITYEVPVKLLPADLTASLQAACEAHDLRIGLTTELKSYPGSTHWHVKRASGAGMIEVTHWPSEGRLWLSVHENRDGGWAKEECPKLARTLTGNIGGRTRSTKR